MHHRRCKRYSSAVDIQYLSNEILPVCDQSDDSLSIFLLVALRVADLELPELGAFLLHLLRVDGRSQHEGRSHHLDWSEINEIITKPIVDHHYQNLNSKI